MHPRESPKTETQRRSEVYHRGGVEHHRRQEQPKALQGQQEEEKGQSSHPTTPSHGSHKFYRCLINISVLLFW